jgi:hypothetical protein
VVHFVPCPDIVAVFVTTSPVENLMTQWSVSVPDGVQTTEVTVTPGT